ncbi:MAG: right-handed parallel beta-helix repeat-containing protein [Planctomycetes bacterium]|nr:right-handed parallel beta-helix repeat-containing protein [Planctomycetota bacterium]
MNPPNRLSRSTSVWLAAGLATFTVRAHATDIIVPPTGSIAAAIRVAGPSDRVLVMPGTYVEQIDFAGKDIPVIGIQGATKTILDGGGAAPVVRFASGQTAAARLIGFTVTGGNSSTGPGGILASGATPTVEDCIVTRNFGRFGGGIGGNPILRRCSIHGNVANVSNGGGIYGAPTIESCVIANNRVSRGSGAGVYVSTGNVSITNSVFVENFVVLTGRKGGGLYISNTANVVVQRCLFVRNHIAAGIYAATGGGIFTASASTRVESCTFFGNTLVGSSSDGASIWGSAIVRDSILRGGTASEASASTVLTYCNVQGGAGGTNIDADPSFVDATNGDFHLDHGSVCVDRGDPAKKDLDGSRIDMGAFAFATLYARANTEAVTWGAPAWSEVSSLVGGKQELRILMGPAAAGAIYVGTGSASGTVPGFSFGSLHVPLNPDWYFLATLGTPNAPWLPGARGTLDANGRGSMAFVLNSGVLAPTAPVPLDHAIVAFASVAVLASDAARVVIQP